MNAYTDDNGYKRGLVRAHSDLISRQVAYLELYLNNRSKYPLPFSKYVVHHINTTKEDNEINNLFICTEREHNLIHEYQIANRKKFSNREQLEKFLEETERVRKATGNNTRFLTPVNRDKAKVVRVVRKATGNNTRFLTPVNRDKAKVVRVVRKATGNNTRFITPTIELSQMEMDFLNRKKEIKEIRKNAIKEIKKERELDIIRKREEYPKTQEIKSDWCLIDYLRCILFTILLVILLIVTIYVLLFVILPVLLFYFFILVFYFFIFGFFGFLLFLFLGGKK
jgi:hypothetical protein